MKCPMCGGGGYVWEHIAPWGTEAATMCCDTPAIIVDNWEVYEGLPESLRRLAIDKYWSDIDEKVQRYNEILSRVAGIWRVLNERYAHLMKGDERCLSKIAPEGGLSD